MAWGERAPDRRMAAGPFEATFSGQLLVQSPGVQRLSAFAAGEVRVLVDAQVVLDAKTSAPAWLEAQPIELDFGYHRLEVHYRRTTETARLGLFWQGPGFDREPLAARWLFHQAGKNPSDRFDKGQSLVRALRCAACHDISGEPPPIPAPALARLAGNISRDWIVGRLAGQRDGGKMPHLGCDPEQAGAIADYLLGTSQPTPPPAAAARPIVAAAPQKTKKKKDLAREQPPEAPNAVAGERLFRTLGCLACHRVGPLGSDGVFGGGDLSKVAEKRPASFFERWLVEPATLNAQHRMPLFPLSTAEVAHLSKYLQTLTSGPAATGEFAPSSVDRGRELVREFRCLACHRDAQSPEAQPTKLAKIDLLALARTGPNCLDDANPAQHRPGYRLDRDQREAVTAFLRNVRSGTPSTAPSGRELLAEHNCLACHARAAEQGLAARLPQVAEIDPTLRAVLPALAPPTLVGIGDKLHDEALVVAIERTEPPRYDWLRVRMPKFAFAPHEARQIAHELIDMDRMPPHGTATAKSDGAPVRDPAVEAAGARLVTAEGFGCTSCHAIGKWKPSQVAPGAEGANLSRLGTRIRREWFDRWVRNPARSVPQMEMPAVQQPIRGVLDGDLPRQLAAVWQVLDLKGFTPPNPQALRVVRRSNLPGKSERATVLTEVIEVGGRTFVKPLVVGLPNRHNVLLDLAAGHLAAWWIGDTARQQTRGKSWFWEGGKGQLIGPDADRGDEEAGEFSLRRGTRKLAALPLGQYATEFDYFEHTAGGLAVGHRLRFADAEEQVLLHIRQEFAALDGSSTAAEIKTSGFRRRVRIEPLAAAATIALEVAPQPATLAAGLHAARLASGAITLEIAVRGEGAAHFDATAQRATLLVDAAAGRAVDFELEYRAAVVADQFTPLPTIDRSATRQELPVVPGFAATRLPVTDQCMPTGLAWRGDGTLAVSSLEGRVWLGRDTDGDGLEDQLTPFSDDLAAPFGLAVSGEAVDVINKYGLLRLLDRDGDGLADRTELLASGWGHTRDYHDWAVGLPRDAAGNYYVSLACQQDQRAQGGAKLRGSVVKLSPHTPTPDDPRRFAIEPLCGGLRFPQGIALNAADDLFVTDNQGNYTPFNELNHVIPGARYGFINRLENEPGFSPPTEAAAVEIPHPWTRSVNGICFLEKQPASSGGGFGPFEGHLIGCEYDTRRLVRISLERVSGAFQGAVYPFSREPAAGAETFEGPLVCAVAPNADLLIGNIRDSGWGAGSNTGSLVRLRRGGELPCGIAEVRARLDGFEIEFTAPVAAGPAGDATSYQVSSYRRVPTPAYGGPDQDRRVEKIRSIALSDDHRRVSVALGELREGFVYEFHLADLAGGGLFFPAEAYYTLRHRPR
jgi:mono/diheme cytochrome c family protein/glucose/arabinose dehydrogenase